MSPETDIYGIKSQLTQDRSEMTNNNRQRVIGGDVYSN